MDQSAEGQTHSMEEVWIKNEPIDNESTTYFHIKCKEELGIVKTETSAEVGESPEVVSIKSEISFGDYEFNPSGSIPLQQVTTNEKCIVEASNKKFNCDECGAKYALKFALKMHQHTHTGEKPHGCDECGKRFTRKESLVRHKRFHTGEKPFACDECGMKFSQKCHVKPHKLTHTGEQQFSCNKCGTKFAHKKGLIQHRKMHTEDRIFCCNICRIKFDKEEYLVRHKREKHGQVRCGET